MGRVDRGFLRRTITSCDQRHKDKISALKIFGAPEIKKLIRNLPEAESEEGVDGYRKGNLIITSYPRRISTTPDTHSAKNGIVKKALSITLLDEEKKPQIANSEINSTIESSNT